MSIARNIVVLCRCCSQLDVRSTQSGNEDR